MDYLSENETIRNKTARQITHINADYTIKKVFGEMVKKGMIEQVPGTRTLAERRIAKAPEPRRLKPLHTTFSHYPGDGPRLEIAADSC